MSTTHYFFISWIFFFEEINSLFFLTYPGGTEGAHTERQVVGGSHSTGQGVAEDTPVNLWVPQTYASLLRDDLLASVGGPWHEVG